MAHKIGDILLVKHPTDETISYQFPIRKAWIDKEECYYMTNQPTDLLTMYKGEEFEVVSEGSGRILENLSCEEPEEDMVMMAVPRPTRPPY
jgi:hypothetical protein